MKNVNTQRRQGRLNNNMTTVGASVPGTNIMAPSGENMVVHGMMM